MRHRILIVHPEPRARYVLNGILTRIGYSVREAADLSEATSIATSSPPDLIFADGNSPGFEQDVVALRSLCPNLRAIILVQDQENEQMRNHEFSDQGHLICKPFLFHDISQKVKNILDGS
jgi:CheY-like chemotaxis protein